MTATNYTWTFIIMGIIEFVGVVLAIIILYPKFKKVLKKKEMTNSLLAYRQQIGAALLVVLICTGCAVEKTPVYERDGIQYGVTEGLFRSRWWNYYERGCSYSEGGYWEEAKADFREAIKQRDEDRRRARTYGVLNFIDYFPHRELGVCYYQEGRHQEAIQELERSAGETPSAKAYYFLDKARREWLLEQKLDSRLPEVMISEPKADEITNAFEVEICGLAADDYFVSRKLYPNVDFYSGIIYQAMRFPVDMFPVLFAIPRASGWLAQWGEMLVDPEQRIARPRQVYLGSDQRDYVPFNQR